MGGDSRKGEERREFEECFSWLSTLDKTMLDMSRVLLFVKAVDVWDQDQVGLLLKTDDEFTSDWAMVKRVCSRFDKRREWDDEGSSAARPVTARKVEEASSA